MACLSLAGGRGSKPMQMLLLQRVSWAYLKLVDRGAQDWVLECSFVLASECIELCSPKDREE